MVWPACDGVALGDADGDHTGERRGDMVGVGAVGLLGGGHLAGHTAVPHDDRPQLAVDDAHHRAHSALVGIGDRLEPDQQFDTALQRDPVLIAVAQAVEELVGRQARGVAVEFAVRLEFLCRAREQQPVQRDLTLGTGLGQRIFVLCGERGLRFGGRAAGQRLGAQRLGPAAGRVAQLAAQEPDDRIRDVESCWIRSEFVGGDARADQRQREVTDDLRRRRHLDQPAQDPVGPGVGGLDLLESIAQPERDGLLTQVRQLATGDLVCVHPARRGGRTGRRNIEGRVHLSQRLPVRLEIAHRRQRQPGVVLGVRGRCDDRAQRGLTRGAGQRRRGTVDGVRAGLPGRQIGRQLPARECRGCARAPGGRIGCAAR